METYAQGLQEWDQTCTKSDSSRGSFWSQQKTCQSTSGSTFQFNSAQPNHVSTPSSVRAEIEQLNYQMNFWNTELPTEKVRERRIKGKLWFSGDLTKEMCWKKTQKPWKDFNHSNLISILSLRFHITNKIYLTKCVYLVQLLTLKGVVMLQYCKVFSLTPGWHFRRSCVSLSPVPFYLCLGLLDAQMKPMWQN